MSWRLLGCVSLFLSLSLGCHRLSNDVDRVRLVCGDGVDPAAPVLRIVGPDAAPLAGGELEAVVLRHGGVTRPALSAKGCLAAPLEPDALLVVRSRAGDRAAVITGDTASGIDQPVALEATPPLLRLAELVPACGDATAARSRLAFRLGVQKSPRLTALRVATRLDGPGGVRREAPLRLVGDAALTGESVVELPDELPEGHYQLTVTVENAFDQAAGLAPKTSVCPFEVDRTTPGVELTTRPAPLALTDDAADGHHGLAPAPPLEADPGQALRFSVSSAVPADVFYCLAPLAEGRPAAPCATYAPAAGGVFAPASGYWSLSYYTRDAAGNQSAVTSEPLAVVHRDVLLRLETELRSLDAGLASRRVVESYRSLFSAFALFGGLGLEIERQSVRADLAATLLRLAPRLGETQRDDGHNSGVLAVTYAPDGQTVAVRTAANQLDVLDAHGTRLETLDGVTDAWYGAGGRTLWLVRQGTTVTVHDLATRHETDVAGGVTLATASGDGSTLVAVTTADGGEAQLVALDATGATLARVALADAAPDHVWTSRDGRTVVIGQDGKLRTWSWQPGAPGALGTALDFEPREDVAGPGGQRGKRCVVGGVAVDPAGRWIYVGSGDTRFGKATLDAVPDEPCGIRRWTVATGATEALSYDYFGLPAAQTPNVGSGAALALSDDGRLFHLSSGSSLLTSWPAGSVTGVWRALADDVSDHGSAMTVLGHATVAAASDKGQLQVFAQATDFAGPRGLPSVRLVPLDAPATALALAPDGGSVVAGDAQGRVRFFRLGQAATRAVATNVRAVPPQVVRLAGGALQTVYAAGPKSVGRIVDGAAPGATLEHPEAVVGLVPLTDGRVVTVTAHKVWLWAADGHVADSVALPAPAAPAVPGRPAVVRLAGALLAVVLPPRGVALVRVGPDGLALGGTLAGAAPDVVLDAALDAGGHTLALLKRQGSGLAIALFDVPTLARLAGDLPLDGPHGRPAPLFAPFAADGQRVVTAAGATASVRRLDGSVEREVPLAAALAEAGSSGAAAVAFAPGGGLLVVPDAASAKAAVRLDLEGRVTARYTGFTGTLQRLEILAGGLILGQGASDTSATAWRPGGAKAYQLGDAEQPAQTVAAAADGSGFATVDLASGRLTVWPVRTVAAAEQEACAALADYLRTRSEDWAVAARQRCGGG